VSRRAGIVAAAVVVVVLLSGTVGALAAAGDLPWQSRAANVARDEGGAATTPGTGSATSAPTLPESTGGTPARGSVAFVPVFTKLPALPRPTNMLEVPGARRMIVSLQDGRVVSFAKDDSTTELTTVIDLSSSTSRAGNEEGLLGLALDPSFSQNGFLYLYRNVSGGARRTVLSRFHVSGSGSQMKADPASELVILTVPQPFSNHNGGQVAFGPADGMLYLGLGDGGSEGDPNGNGQDITKNLLGSIIRIDVRNATSATPYTIPPDNPFASSPNGARPETFAYGLRNPWRFSFDKGGRLLAGDVGQNQWEEIDYVQAGENFGWNVMEASHCYKPSTGCNQSGLTLPIAEYSHDGGNCSVTGGYIAAGGYVLGDYCTGAVWVISGVFSNSAPPVLRQIRKSGPQIPTFAQGSDGEVYLLTFDGKIERIDFS
jgi:glucose/arabinose dehydrogenase